MLVFATVGACIGLVVSSCVAMVGAAVAGDSMQRSDDSWAHLKMMGAFLLVLSTGGVAGALVGGALDWGLAVAL